MTFKGTLYDFQVDASKMMLDRQLLLLTHDMGLGKTVTSIATVEELIDARLVDVCLVICPASVKWQWKRMIDTFTDGALVLVVEGNKNERWAQYRIIRRGEVEYVVMNYEQVVADWDTLHHFSWDAVICDEVTYIKSPSAKRTRHVRRIHAPYQFGLTGQPIENRPEELYAIMEWVDPSVLGRHDAFEHTFIKRNQWGRVERYKNLKFLRELMTDAMHRRTRKDVADQMPDVVDQVYVIDWDRPTRHVYDKVADELIDVIRGQATYSTFNLDDHYAGIKGDWVNGEVMPRLMAMRMLSDHPALLQHSADLFDDPQSKAGSMYAAGLRKRGALDRLGRHPKLAVAQEVIQEILDADDRNKVVLFSFFKPMLAMISAVLTKLKIGHGLFTGDVTPKERDAVVERFSTDPRCRVLLSSDAGGIGVDLPAANYLISYDLPWSAGKFKQRQTRIDRISSEWPEITLISLVMRNSVEEWMLDVLDQKAAVAAAWLDGEGVDSQGTFELQAAALCDYLEAH